MHHGDPPRQQREVEGLGRAEQASIDLGLPALVELDPQRVVTRANERFLSRTGYTAGDIAAGLTWSALMTPAGRIMFETQLAPMLALNGSM